MTNDTEKKEVVTNQNIPKKRIVDSTFNEETAIQNSKVNFSDRLETYLSQSTIKNKKSLLKEILYIKREGTLFEIPLKEILIFNIPVFRCKRCGHMWSLQNRRRASLRLPNRCAKCNVKYWFVSREEMKKLGLLRKNVIYSLTKSKLKVVDLEPKRKYKAKKEDNEEW